MTATSCICAELSGGPAGRSCAQFPLPASSSPQKFQGIFKGWSDLDIFAKRSAGRAQIFTGLEKAYWVSVSIFILTTPIPEANLPPPVETRIIPSEFALLKTY